MPTLVGPAVTLPAPSLHLFFFTFLPSHLVAGPPVQAVRCHGRELQSEVPLHMCKHSTVKLMQNHWRDLSTVSATVPR
jgi:hypothetical protein